MLLAQLGLRGQYDFELLSLGAVEKDLHVLLRQILKGRVKAEAIVRREAMEHAAAPAIGAVAERGSDESPLVESALRIGDQQRRMHAHRRADAGTRRARAGRIVERELKRLHLAGDEPMFGAAEAVVELFVRGGRLLRLHDVKAEQAVTQLQAVLQRRHDLLVDARGDDERIDHRLDGMRLLLVELDVLAQVAWLAVDPRPAVAVDADLLEEVL